MPEKRIVEARGVEIGAGMPKICVSITGRTEEEILSQGRELAVGPVDVAEWRADYCQDILDRSRMEDILSRLPRALGGKPLLFTFRRKEEGGERAVPLREYRQMSQAALESGRIDLIDVELSAGESLVRDLIEEAHKRQVKAVVSSHDFEKTPGQEELLERFRRMQGLGGDLPKIAVMPNCSKDVLDLLSAAEEFERKYADRPFVAISMGGLGLASRLCGQLFGSAMTFGSIGAASAPGQIEAKKLKEILEALGVAWQE